MSRLADKVALITGAGSGIGREAALLFAREGARVAVADISGPAGAETVCRIAAEGGEAICVETDVGEPDSVAAAVADTVARFGGLHILYNNAGGTMPGDGSIVDAPVESFWSSIRVNLLGTWLGCKFAIPHMAALGGGSIVNTASMAGVIGIPPFHGYAAAKGGVIAMTRSLAAEYASSRIRVNAIAPGMTATERLRDGLASGRLPRHLVDRHALGLVEPAAVVKAALFLACEDSLQITGQTIPVDSGASTSFG